MLNIIRSPVLRQYTIVLIANLTMVNLGLSIVWTSPMLIKLRQEDQTMLSRPVTEDEEAWIVSIGFLSGITVLFITGNLMDWLGRKTVLLGVYIPRFIMCFLFIFGTEVWMVLLGRLIAGVADWVTVTVVSTYASEVAGTKIRGSCGTITQILSATGMMIMFAVGPYASYMVTNVVMTCIVAVTLIPLLFIPESPFHLNAKGNVKKAEEVLTYLRGSSETALIEMKEYAKEIDKPSVDIRSLIKDKILIKTVGIALFLAIGIQLAGYNAVNFYLQSIFESTQTSISSEISSLIIGCIQLIACICTFAITDRFGRKPILCVTIIAMSLGMIGLASFFVIFENGRVITGFLNFLPLLSVAFVIFGYNAGLGSLFWMQIAELYEGSLRPYGVTSAAVVSNFTIFLLTLFFPSIINAIGASNTYWIFAVCGIILCLFIFFFVPETKGRSFAEIQRALGRKDLIVDDNFVDIKS